jgi:hypothetical protein
MNHDVHCPMLMHKYILQRLERLRWEQPFGFCLKSVYAHAAQIAGVQQADLKLRRPFLKDDIAGRQWFSTADGVVEKSLGVMNKLYPKPSKYETK